MEQKMNKLFSKSFIIFLEIIFIFISVTSFRAWGEEAPLRGLDQYIEQARQDWQVPGVAVAIIKDGRIVWAKGYGVREQGKPDPVDAHTIFAVGSTTKAFTAAALGLLVEEKKLNWDDPVHSYLPDFQLFDPESTDQLSFRDLLSHRCGLSRADFLWYGTSNDRQEILRRLRYLKPICHFRSQYGYQNIMFLAAGEAIPAITGQSWDDFVKERFFIPLGMDRTSTSIKDLEELDDIASPHIDINGAIKPIPWRNIDNIGPAAAINSDVIDMAKWLQLHLNKGWNGNQQLIRSEILEDMAKAQIGIPLTPAAQVDYPGSHMLSYGLGWFLDDYQGHRVIEHGGAIDGMTAYVAMIPDQNLGIVVLTNMEHSWLPRVLKYEIFDRYLQEPARDWNTYFLTQFQQNYDREYEPGSSVRKGNFPSQPLDSYVGVYHDNLGGEVIVSLDKNGQALHVDFLAFKGTLEHWNGSTFMFDPSLSAPTQLAKWFVTFSANSNGFINEVSMSDPSLAHITFKRVE